LIVSILPLPIEWEQLRMKRQFYEENKPFTCLDGSRTIPFDRVNDDYCDCRDGSDEPGTAACPNGSFHCTNAGFRPTFIPSSRINDGICDCCDTTDEYNSGAKCENTCKELGQKEHEVLQKMAEITKEGFLLKQQLIQEAKNRQQEKQSKLTELQNNKKELEEKVEALRTVKETAEQPEKEAKELHLKAWEEQKAIIRAEKDKAKMAEAFLELDDDADGFVAVAELQTHAELDTDADGTVSETEAQGLLGGVDHVDTASFEKVWDNIKDKYVSEVSNNSQDSHTPDITRKVEYNYVPFHLMKCTVCFILFCEHVSKRSFLVQAPPTVKTPPKKDEDEEAMPPYDDETRVLIDAAQKARDNFEESERALRDSYIVLCRYIYKLCPFNRVSQKPKYGGSETNLGTWGTWAGPEDNKYLLMKYEHGTGCWQGPNRSTTVKLTCGKETTVMSTSEPSRCEYLMEFTTPAVCQEPEAVISSLHGHDEF
uniref:Glucosidase 2 subunit beta n=1 Tax=Pygocentrus nattereri TaxID=42514 RepID=A0AAR2LJ98_PYGNA